MKKGIRLIFCATLMSACIANGVSAAQETPVLQESLTEEKTEDISEDARDDTALIPDSQTAQAFEEGADVDSVETDYALRKKGKGSSSSAAAPAAPAATGMDHFSQTFDNVTLSYDYTAEVSFDGRKHVWNNGKSVATASVNPDIKVENVTLSAGGKTFTGVTLAGVKCTNNVNASAYDKNYEGPHYMMLSLKLKLDTKDKELADYMKSHKRFKKDLALLASPKLYKRPGSDGYKVWSWLGVEPAFVVIKQINVYNTPIYTNEQLKADPSLGKKNGIFIWSGKSALKWSKLNDGVNDKLVPVKADLKGLTYQLVVQVAGGGEAVKRIKLTPGEWKASGDNVEVNPGNADYYLAFYEAFSKGSKTVQIDFDAGNFDGVVDFTRSEDDIARDPK